MKKLIVLGLIAGFANVAFAEDGSFTGTVDMGTNKANNGGIMVSGEKQAPKIILPGRRGD